jgi:acyl-CoA thioester hydrolase
MMRSAFTFLHPLRVRWAECDAQGIVFNGNYFLYFDVAMGEWLRALGFEPATTIEFFTVRAEADYKAPAKFDDMLDVAARCARLGEKSMTLKFAVFRGEDLLTEGALTYVHADLSTRKSTPIPKEFIDRVLAFERTAPERKSAS